MDITEFVTRAGAVNCLGVVVSQGGEERVRHLWEPVERRNVYSISKSVTSLAVGMAESRGLGFVMMANHGGDHAIYPDCRPDFVEAFDRAAQAGTYNGVRLLSPYVGLTKGQIAARGRQLGIDYAETWSCYKGGERHCGRCGTCVERREALAEAGIADPTEYEP